jgi:hypothetical protein
MKQPSQMYRCNVVVKRPRGKCSMLYVAALHVVQNTVGILFASAGDDENPN